MHCVLRLSMQTLSFKDSVPSGEHDLFDLIRIASQLGYDGVDLEDRQFESTEPDYLERVRRHALDLGLPIGYVGTQGGFGQHHHGDDDGHATHIRRWIDVASAMLCPMVRVIGCEPSAGETDEDAWPRTVDRMRDLAAYGRERGVLIGLHNHNHRMFPATAGQVVRMLDEVDDPRFVHVLDTGQYRGSRGATGYEDDPDRGSYDLYENIAGSIDRAIAVRAKIYRIASGEEEWIDYRRVMQILKRSRFQGWLSVVFEGRDDTPPMKAMELAAAHLRSLLREFDI